MNKEYKEYEKSIKKEHRFGSPPKFETDFKAQIPAGSFIPIAEKAIKKLGWDIVFMDKKSIKANRNEKLLGINRWSEGITAALEHGKIKVTSVSLGNELWDNGRNSRRAKLFVHAFQDTVKSLSGEELQGITKEFEEKRNWDDYKIPETLPKPKKSVVPKFHIPILGGLILSCILGLILAQVSISGKYVIGLFEFLIGLAIGFSFKYLIRFSNFTNFEKLHGLLISVVVLTYALNQYLQYELVLFGNNYERIGFVEFMKFKFDQGLTIEGLDTGWIGLVVSWILQLVITYYVALLFMVSSLTAFLIKSVPEEVVDFAFYHFVKGKSEDQVRKELASKGWTDPQNQNEVFEAISAIQDSIESSSD